MKIDVLMLRILDWIRRFIFYEEAKTKQKPYSTIRSISFEGRGTLRLISGRDTPKAVRTWVFVPDRKLENAIYILLDSLEQQEGEKRESKDHKTHRVQILSVSRFLNVKGQFTSETIFTADYDFVYDVSAVDPNKVARIIIDRVLHVFKYRAPADIDWAYEIESGRSEIFGLSKPDKTKKTNIKLRRVLMMLMLLF